MTAASAPCTVVGLPCAGDGPGEDARRALAAAATVVGSPRQLAAAEPWLDAGAARVDIGGDLAGLDDGLAGRPPVAVLASGDPGLFGVLRAVRARCDGPVAATPAVSSAQAVLAAAGLPWDDAVVLSAHGRDPRPAIHACRRLAKAVVLTGPELGPAGLVAALDPRPRDMWVGARLGTPEAEVRRLRVVGGEDLSGQDFAEPNVVALADADAGDAPRGWAAPPRLTAARWGLDEAAFEHRDGQVTKAEVRAQALAWLGPGLGDLVWDVGCGAGSVAVEAARLGAAAIAVDRDGEQAARARSNAAAHGVPVEVRQGVAPAALAALPDPDAAFVGGGGAEAVAAAAARARRAVVVALAAVERIGPAWQALAEAGLDVEGVQLAASRLTALPDGAHRLAAANPVTLLGGRRR